MNHYYSRQPTAEHNVQSVVVHARGQAIALQTDSGVFSKRGLDFGTRVLIETVELPEEGTIVDLGCGYGPVAGVLAGAYPHTHWVLLDINQRAVALARSNLSRYNERVEVFESDGFEVVPDLKAAAVLLNPPIRAGKEMIYRLFSDAREHLLEGGTLWIVIQKKQGAASAYEKLLTLFEEVDLVERSGGYHVYRCLRN